LAEKAGKYKSLIKNKKPALRRPAGYKLKFQYFPQLMKLTKAQSNIFTFHVK